MISDPVMVDAAADLALGKARTGRECGACSLCCKVLDVPRVEEKKSHEWCPHARPGRGCHIYKSRPGECRDFACGWLIDPALSDDWHPLRSKIVVHLVEEPPLRMTFHVDPSYPARWREEPFYSYILASARLGFRMQDFFETRVHVGKRVITIGPNGEEWDSLLLREQARSAAFVVTGAAHIGAEKILGEFLAAHKSFAPAPAIRDRQA